jgi:hypothetical protein
MEWSDVESKLGNLPGNLKLLAAALGTGAVVAMGALTVIVTSGSDGTVMSDPTTRSTGETVTSSTAPSTLDTPFATPPITSTEDSG